jgi:Protein of unknown function (DUF2939)
MMKSLRRIVWTLVLLGTLGAAYVATPFLTAWTIREAIKSNDSAYLEKKIDWVSVRATLKESLGKFAFGPGEDLVGATEPPKPTMWQRIKSYVGRGAVDRFVDTTITPTGMAGLFTARKAMETHVTGVEDPAKRPPIWERMRRVWSRVTRAEFVRLDRFEMEMLDKNAPDRTIHCVLELRNYHWMMTEIRVKPTKALAANRLLALQ